jgi:hypothetical protein
MVKLGLIKAAATPIKNIFSKAGKTINEGSTEKGIGSLSIANAGIVRVKEIFCIPLVPDTMCYEVYEDGYIHAIR